MRRLERIHWHLRYGLWVGAGVALVLAATVGRAGLDFALLSPVAGAVYGTAAGAVLSLFSPQRPWVDADGT